MTRIDLTTRPGTPAIQLWVLAGLLAAAGCSDSAAIDKRDDPSLKGSMQKSMEIYKSKSQTPSKKVSSGPAIKRPK
jgi:hypothetical protein